MNPYKSGDIVVCIDADGTEGLLREKYAYTVDKVAGDFVYLEGVQNEGWFYLRFAAVRKSETYPFVMDILTPRVPYESLTLMANQIHADNVKAGWWDQADNPLIVATNIALIHSEVSEAMEGDRRGLMDDHLPQHTMLACELGDVFIRLADLAGYLKIDLGRVIADKLAYNAKRADHKPENRKARGGKKY